MAAQTAITIGITMEFWCKPCSSKN